MDGLKRKHDDGLCAGAAFSQESICGVRLDLVLEFQFRDARDNPEEAVGFEERAFGSEDGGILSADPDFTGELGEETLFAGANRDAGFRLEGDDGGGFTEGFFIGQTGPEIAVAEGVFMDGVGKGIDAVIGRAGVGTVF